MYEKSAKSLKIQILRSGNPNWFNVFATSVPTAGTYTLPTVTLRVKSGDQIRLAPSTGIANSSRNGVYQSNTAIVAFRSAQDDATLAEAIDYTDGTSITSETANYTSGTAAAFDGTTTTNKSGNEYGIKSIASSSSSSFVQLNTIDGTPYDTPFDVSFDDTCLLTQAYSIVNSASSYTRTNGHGLYSMKFTDTIESLAFGAKTAPASVMSLKSIKIGKGVTSLGEYCFSGCSKLESLTIPATVRNIGGTSTFQDCTSLKSITFMDDSTWSDATSTFDGLSSITKIDLSPVTSLTVLGKNAVADCPKLTDLDIRNVTTFYTLGTVVNCASLTTLTLSPNLVTTAFGKAAFKGLPALTRINIMNWTGTQDTAITYKTNVLSKIKNSELKATYQNVTVCFYAGSDTSSETKAIITGL